MRHKNSPLNRLSSPHRAYSSSLTDSCHSVSHPSPGISRTMCENHESGLAPCQCSTPSGTIRTMPGCNAIGSLSRSRYNPSPAVQISCCPPPEIALCTCQCVRQLGSNVTLTSRIPPSLIGFRYDCPSKNSAYAVFGSPTPNWRTPRNRRFSSATARSP